ncbi:hypothetical protein [Natrialba aegyptia]|uniref:Small CPxCG-related zinc finger protein n=1 Tax=Natrialba aegyptia DSM 13077 TaxID=1227491 RepID=M0BHP1_9EURY|nr:hypothetical protein [Natrialba aegyptia]ELZ10401.1 hypothetical protein C480_00620 [Natrialba aegyptia DSM 13077]
MIDRSGMTRQHRSGWGAKSSMREAVKSVLLGRGETTTIEECRRCGRTTDTPDTVCPTCGCTEIVTYRIE